MTYGDSPQRSFETLCNHLFERYLNRNYKGTIANFRVINGAGGDGGIEAYTQLKSGNIIAIQSKWFRNVLETNEIGQIKSSIIMALTLRPNIAEYIICIPRNITSTKFTRGKVGEQKKPSQKHEENTVKNFEAEIKTLYSDLKITWWFEKDIESELMQLDNEGVHKFWFEKEVLSLKFLNSQFYLQKKGWLSERYIPKLHSQGIINQTYQRSCFCKEERYRANTIIIGLIDEIGSCLALIEKFSLTNESPVSNLLDTTKQNLALHLSDLKKISSALLEGNDYFEEMDIHHLDVGDAISKLKDITPNNIQKTIIPKLRLSLENINRTNSQELIKNISRMFNQRTKLILGEPGTGKTHGLANCVELQLNQNCPAIIIQAKDCPSKNWTQILCHALEVDWKKEEVFSALEAIAVKNDVRMASNLVKNSELNSECSKALICIDGLEEDVKHYNDWHMRIKECEAIQEAYPKIRFMFSARSYFYKKVEHKKSEAFEPIWLPREGDVNISEISHKYFAKDQYNIRLSSPELIKGLDSLFALRLFCDKYKDTSLSERDKIITATRGLLNLKIDKMNEGYILSLDGQVGSTRKPILDALDVIADCFYSEPKVSHINLAKLVFSQVGNYLDVLKIDLLIDYLVDNGFLIRITSESQSIPKKIVSDYNITYQSIIDHIISERIYQKIKRGEIDEVPQYQFGIMAKASEDNIENWPDFDMMPNETIIQSIADNIFAETGRLIGENGFLTKGLDEWQIKRLQYSAIHEAPADISAKYKDKIKQIFCSGYTDLSYLLEYLILPSSYSADSIYGSEFLHEMLMSMNSTFERDIIWSGLDSYEQSKLDELERFRYKNETNKVVFKEAGVGPPVLSPNSLNNERPLIFAWGLSTLDQRLRSDLRIALTGWAIKSPKEFKLLLEKMLLCNDPQIHEDLASIMLGVASKLKVKEDIKVLAIWSNENIFSKIEQFRNVIIRQGFRAIVERAFQYKLISKKDVEKARPKRLKSIATLPLEKNLTYGQEGCYPIVHDLAWYVIEKAFNGFLEHPTSRNNQTIDSDCKEGKRLLDLYRNLYDIPNLFASNWTMAVAIAYIKSLGFTRTEGNWNTQATHGSKSTIYTYEEKYTWLAVHHIQGYLSDYIPLLQEGGRAQIVDYTQITDIPNPANKIVFEAKYKNKDIPADWIIKEILSKEVDTNANVEGQISNWVSEEPNLNFENWLYFDSGDFTNNIPIKSWLALYNGTALYDSKEIVYTNIKAYACLVKKKDLEGLKKVVIDETNNVRFTNRIESLHTSPKVYSYSNPIDVVWMTWIEEYQNSQEFYNPTLNNKAQLFYTLSKVMQIEGKGEKQIMLPSKLSRDLLEAYELSELYLSNSKDDIIGFNHQVFTESYRDNQEIVLVDRDAFNSALEKSGYEMIWFIELFKKKNPLNDEYKAVKYDQRTRKYFVYEEKGRLNSVKFWDAYFSNQKDDFVPEPIGVRLERMESKIKR